ncbi:histone-lysine N-methyltransferase SETD1B [Drosophila ficusphila]|uniref:histone-lysine N-methyltransferase SETD1B n=1 Tax=Drosophila ficusphila TaxID=30025 RepID=UPI0007E873B1|nr:histone-lysine N-methyltransferase SETD1B [Drosophila ficusphila]
MLMPRYLGLNDSSPSSGSHGPAGAPSSSSSSSPPTTVAAHTKMRLLSKVEHNMRQSQGHIPSHPSGQDINHLLQTASTGNGVVGDVDGLLTPMRIKAHLSPPYSAGSSVKSESLSSNSRPERNLWSRAEMLEMLNIMQNVNALEQLNDRNVKSEYVFRQIEEVMRSKGYVKKSSMQIWTKWKFLKSTYNTTTRHGTGVPKVVPEEVYRVLCRMLRDTNHGGSSGNVNGSLSECGNSMDSSKTTGEEAKEDILGVEHPIFGFRLGPIKPEPIDTGYETSQKPDLVSEPDMESFDYEAESSHADNQDQEDMPHMPFIVSVKHEPDMDLGMDTTNTPPPTAPASPSPPPMALDETDDDSAYSSTPAVPPPLRVASFAKDDLRRPTHGILQIDRPPPSLSKMGQQLPSPGQMGRSLPLPSTSSINFVHPHSKLMLPRKQNPNSSQSGLRLPRDVSVQPTGMRMKTVPMRDTGYSLRPERMIPDLEQSMTSPPQSPSTMAALLGRGPPPKYPMSGQQTGASTSRQAHMMSSHQLTPMQHQQLQSRKRRMGQSPVMGMPVPVKLQRSSNLYESTPKGIRSHSVMGEESKKKTSEEETKQRMKRKEEMFAKELTQLATAMRSAQKEMLQDFFMQQKEIARREHEFQMKQDTIVMQALRRQTNALLKTARELVNENTEAAKTETEPKNRDIPETQMPFEPETELKAPESEEENLVGDGEADDEVEETIGEPEDEDHELDDEDENDEEEDGEEEDEDDEENLGNDSDLEMSTLAMSECSNQVEILGEEQ